MATFLEDPRLRQRWNQISHNAETVTENAAAGIWTFQHRYVEPCLASLAEAVEPCIAPCLGDRDERAARLRRGAHHSTATHRAAAEYTFDFYDDWDDDDEALAATRGSVDWERLLTGEEAENHQQQQQQQPRRKRGMSYGTRRGGEADVDDDDPSTTIIPSTAPLGFLGRLPWKVGGTLRYKPSAAFLKDHPGGGARLDENRPLLDREDENEDVDLHPHVTRHTHSRKRSGTAGSGVSSDSYRSRGDLFPSDGEEYEDAMEIDDEFAVALARVDDRASSNTRSSKGKRPARRGSRAVSATTLSSSTSKSSLRAAGSGGQPRGQQQSNLEDSMHSTIVTPSMEDLQLEEDAVARQEDEEVARKRQVAAQLARQRGLSAASSVEMNYSSGESEARAAKREMLDVEEIIPEPPRSPTEAKMIQQQQPDCDDEFIPARLPNFR